MSFVRDLVFTHLLATALMLTVFVAVATWQRCASVLRARRAGAAEPAAAAHSAPTPALEWSIDLRDAASDGVLLTKAS